MLNRLDRILGLFISCILSGSVESATIEQVKIQDHEIMGVCRPIDGQHAVSIQARTVFSMAGDGDTGSSVYGDPKKSYQSFECGGTKATLYYYQYSNASQMQSRLEFIKRVIWGESGPTRMHPELLLSVDNVLAVVSGPEPEFLAGLISHRIEFPDLEKRIVRARRSAAGCGSNKEATKEVCAALDAFLSGDAPKGPAPHGRTLVGWFWDMSEKGDIRGSGYEILYLGSDPDTGWVASFGRAFPENEIEQEMCRRQMEAQRLGQTATDIEPLLEFTGWAYGSTKAAARLVGERSLAFIGLGNRVYVRRAPGQLVLTTRLMHEPRSEPYVVAVFPTE